jgi:hypothetical protein
MVATLQRPIVCAGCCCNVEKYILPQGTIHNGLLDPTALFLFSGGIIDLAGDGYRSYDVTTVDQILTFCTLGSGVA